MHPNFEQAVLKFDIIIMTGLEKGRVIWYYYY